MGGCLGFGVTEYEVILSPDTLQAVVNSISERISVIVISSLELL